MCKNTNPMKKHMKKHIKIIKFHGRPKKVLNKCTKVSYARVQRSNIMKMLILSKFFNRKYNSNENTYFFQDLEF